MEVIRGREDHGASVGVGGSHCSRAAAGGCVRGLIDPPTLRRISRPPRLISGQNLAVLPPLVRKIKFLIKNEKYTVFTMFLQNLGARSDLIKEEKKSLIRGVI